MRYSLLGRARKFSSWRFNLLVFNRAEGPVKTAALQACEAVPGCACGDTSQPSDVVSNVVCSVAVQQWEQARFVRRSLNPLSTLTLKWLGKRTICNYLQCNCRLLMRKWTGQLLWVEYWILITNLVHGIIPGRTGFCLPSTQIKSCYIDESR